MREWNLIEFLCRNDKFIVDHGDKSLGTCIVDREVYIYKGCLDHLGSTTNYKKVTTSEARRRLHYALGIFIKKYAEVLLRPEVEFPSRSLHRYPTKIAKFCMTAKVHKDPRKMRPIVCCFGTFIND